MSVSELALFLTFCLIGLIWLLYEFFKIVKYGRLNLFAYKGYHGKYSGLQEWPLILIVTVPKASKRLKIAKFVCYDRVGCELFSYHDDSCDIEPGVSFAENISKIANKFDCTSLVHSIKVFVSNGHVYSAKFVQFRWYHWLFVIYGK